MRLQSLQDAERVLRGWLDGSRRLVILGVRNSMRRDDSVGLRVIERLQQAQDRTLNIKLIRCETVPENYLGVIKRLTPSHVLIVDAADAGLPPGSVFHSDVEGIERKAFSTHNIPLKIFANLIFETVGSKVALLAIQPLDIGFGEGLSPPLEDALKQVTELLKAILLRVSR